MLLTGESLLTPTAIYCKLLRVLRSRKAIKSVAHITGGGLLENLPRVLPSHLGAWLDAERWNVPPVFGWLFDEGDLEEGWLSLSALVHFIKSVRI